MTMVACQSRRRRRRVGTALLAAAIVATACSSSGSGSGTTVAPVPPQLQAAPMPRTGARTRKRTSPAWSTSGAAARCTWSVGAAGVPPSCSSPVAANVARTGVPRRARTRRASFLRSPSSAAFASTTALELRPRRPRDGRSRRPPRWRNRSRPPMRRRISTRCWRRQAKLDPTSSSATRSAVPSSGTTPASTRRPSPAWSSTTACPSTWATG